LTVVPLDVQPLRISPPAELTKAQRAIFASIAANNAHLRPADSVMLGLFVQAVTKSQSLAKKSDAASIASWEKTSRVAAMWATKLRLTVQSQVLPDAAGRKRDAQPTMSRMQQFLEENRDD
jgi:hypothetical protein